MIVSYPKYYDKFKCIADKCPASCCKEWRVVVDENTAKYYRSIDTDFGKVIVNSMEVDDEGDIIFKNKNDQCPFLNQCGLCDIHINLGENHTPLTCQKYPRFENYFGNNKEIGLSLSCPVAIDLIINNSTYDLAFDGTDDLPELNDLDPDVYNAVKVARDRLFEYIKKDSCNLSAVVNFAKEVQMLIYSEGYRNINSIEFAQADVSIPEIDFQNFEYLNDNNKKYFDNLHLDFNVNLDVKARNILSYYIYRYVLLSAYEGDFLGRVMFSVFSTVTIANIQKSTGLSIEKATLIYSREIEHSQYNLDVLYDNLA